MNKSKKLELQATNLIKQSKLKKKTIKNLK
jgi:hypothetical protein